MPAVAVELAKLELKAGDTLVVTVPMRINDEQRNGIDFILRPIVPSGVRVLVLDGGTSLSVLSAQ